MKLKCADSISPKMHLSARKKKIREERALLVLPHLPSSQAPSPLIPSFNMLHQTLWDTWIPAVEILVPPPPGSSA